MDNKIISFTTIKGEFDKKYRNQTEFDSLVPIHLTYNKKVKIKKCKRRKK